MELSNTREVIIGSKFSPEVALKRLAEYIEPNWTGLLSVKWPFERKHFQGAISHNNFSIKTSRLVPNSNSTGRDLGKLVNSYLKMKIDGVVSESENGTVIKLLIADYGFFRRKKGRLFFAIFFSVICSLIMNLFLENLLISTIIATLGWVFIYLFLNIINEYDDFHIDKCESFFKDLFNDNISLPYEMPGFIYIAEKSKFDKNNNIMHTYINFYGFLCVLFFFPIAVSSEAWRELPEFIGLFSLFIPYLGVSLLYKVTCRFAWLYKNTGKGNAQPDIQPDR